MKKIMMLMFKHTVGMQWAGLNATRIDWTCPQQSHLTWSVANAGSTGPDARAMARPRLRMIDLPHFPRLHETLVVLSDGKSIIRRQALQPFHERRG